MNIFMRIHDRLTGVLGRDCQGKPLRKGDQVIAVVGVRPEYEGLEAMVMRLYQPPGATERLAWGSGPWVLLSGNLACRASCLKRVDFDEGANWDRTSEITGWTPRTIKQPSEVTQ
ncbi:hypothetical protein FZZ93_01175 [Halomonas eurihalina]|uniref:Uncharacterized protein n=1 Tax=Halomonas eurihalina TaxID=42566 RepID=A0A5D9DF64_HALER|nr:hypothetical protein [Halomonas eurihalina]MDR5858195.1 hypothetical protein [Halomonas eurihalina]TZG41305.1 hypothetical protein FZZ93_01175 [Halomonas eurihalina]